MIHLDTHVVIWLAARDLAKISPAAQARIEQQQSFISPMVLLELNLLDQRGRLSASPQTIIDGLEANIDLAVSETRFETVVNAALGLTWTRDRFDRLIVANARADGAELLTADRLILTNFAQAIW